MAASRLECFRDTIQKNFSFLKEVETVDQLWAKAISIEKGKKGFWMPIAGFHLENPSFDVELQSFFKNIDTRAGTFTYKDFRSQVIDLGLHQVGIFYVDRFGNKQAVMVLSMGNVEKCEIRLSHLSVIKSLNEFDFTDGLKELASWLNSSFVVDQFTSQEDYLGLLGKAGFERLDGYFCFRNGTQNLGKKEILTAGPSISSQEASYALDAAKYGWNDEWAKYLKKFESKFADYIGVKHALATSSCTGALHIALKTLDIGPGDEVIVPEMTWVATASAVEYVGGIPVFAEIEKDTWCMDPTKLEKLITPKTKCIIPVHLYGHPADMDKIMEIANRHKIYVIEDAAPAIGAECRGRKVGNFGHFSTFSFQGAKLLVSGEGGLLITNDSELYKKASVVWDHGRTPGTFWINQVGLKYKMSNIQAALGLAQVERAEEQIHAKRRIFKWYESELGNFDGITLCREAPWARSIYWMSSLLIDSKLGLSRDEFFKSLKEYKIDTRPVFPSISSFPMWKLTRNTIAQQVGEWGVNLPSGVCLNEDQVRYVARSIKEIISNAK